MTHYRESMRQTLDRMYEINERKRSESIVEDNMDLMRKAAGGAMQTIKMKDGKLKMDKVTASAIMQIYDKVNPVNQKKMEKMINDGNKSGIIKIADFAMSKVTGFKSEETELDEKKILVANPKTQEVIKIDEKDWPKYEKKGYVQAEETELGEAKETWVVYNRDNGKAEKYFSNKIPADRHRDKLNKKYEASGNLPYAVMQTEEVELDEKTKWRRGDGRPRGAAHIENERFWDLPKSELEYIIKDAGEAMRLNPTARKATTGRGNWADQVNDAHTVLGWRRKNSIIEASARSDAMKAMRKSGEFKDKDDDDIRATDADVKAASKNILMQMKSAADLPKGGEIEFLDKKKVKVPQKVAQLFVQKYMSLRRPADKAKFQEKAAKSYKDFISAMKEGVESEHTILDRIHNKIQERKNV